VTAPSNIDPACFLHDQLESSSLRSMPTTLVNTLMPTGPTRSAVPPYGAPSPDRVNVRNGLPAGCEPDALRLPAHGPALREGQEGLALP
jgi:hypothetical protein